MPKHVVLGHLLSVQWNPLIVRVFKNDKFSIEKANLIMSISCLKYLSSFSIALWLKTTIRPGRISGSSSCQSLILSPLLLSLLRINLNSFFRSQLKSTSLRKSSPPPPCLLDQIVSLMCSHDKVIFPVEHLQNKWTRDWINGNPTLEVCEGRIYFCS